MSDADKFLAFANTLREMDDATSKTIRISHNQVLDIVIGDLVEKYKFNVSRDNKEWTSAFEKVLRYYLDEQEIDQLKKETV